MKKITILLLVLFALTSCGQVTNQASSENSKKLIESNEEIERLSIFGDLDIYESFENLEIRTSSCWQKMRSDITDKIVGKYDRWKIAIYTDANLLIVFGYNADEDSIITTDENYNDEFNKLVEKELKDVGYAVVDMVRLDDRCGFIVDVLDNNITKRTLFVNDKGGRYEISFTNQTDSLSSLELQFAYDYLKSLHFIDNPNNTNHEE